MYDLGKLLTLSEPQFFNYKMRIISTSRVHIYKEQDNVYQSWCAGSSQHLELEVLILESSVHKHKGWAECRKEYKEESE